MVLTSLLHAIFIYSIHLCDGSEKFSLSLDLKLLNLSFTGVSDPSCENDLVDSVIKETHCISATECYDVCVGPEYYFENGSSEVLIQNAKSARKAQCVRDNCKDEPVWPKNGRLFIVNGGFEVQCYSGYHIKSTDDQSVRCLRDSWVVPECERNRDEYELIYDILQEKDVTDSVGFHEFVIELLQHITNPNGTLAESFDVTWGTSGRLQRLVEILQSGSSHEDRVENIISFYTFLIIETLHKSVVSWDHIDWNDSNIIGPAISKFIKGYDELPSQGQESPVHIVCNNCDLPAVTIMLPSTGNVWIKCEDSTCVQVCSEGFYTTEGDVMMEVQDLHGVLTATPCFNQTKVNMTSCSVMRPIPDPPHGEIVCPAGMGSCYHICDQGYAFQGGHTEELVVCVNYEWIINECLDLQELSLDIDELCDLTCENRGTCVIEKHKKMCQCPWPFEGPTCRHILPPHPCTVFHIPIVDNGDLVVNGLYKVSVICKSQHALQINDDQRSISCYDEDWLSMIGTLKCYKQCQQLCQNGGTCNKEGFCDCTPNHSGTYCENLLPDAFICQYGAMNCQAEKLVCPSGWKGEGCLVPECFPGCRNGGKCLKGGECACLNEWSGKYCQSHSSIQTQIPDLCSRNSVIVKDGGCACFEGYYGKRCEITTGQPQCITEDITWTSISVKERSKLHVCLGEDQYLDLGKVIVMKQCMGNKWHYWNSQPMCEPVCKPSCFNGGTCLSGNQCSCRRGFSGRFCEDKEDIVYTVCKSPKPTKTAIIANQWNTLNKRCRAEGSILDIEKTQIKIDCKDGEWTSEVIRSLCICYPKCQNGGHCISGSNTCQCPDLTSGIRCENKCDSPMPSLLDHIKYLKDSLNSRCLSGVPDLESVDPVFECQGQGHWELQYNEDTLRCVRCIYGCSFPMTCHVSFYGHNFGTCRPIKGRPCKTSRIPNGKVHLRTPTSGTLICDHGYTFDKSWPITCVDGKWTSSMPITKFCVVDNCKNKCRNGGHCNQGRNHCSCPVGFTGKYCQVLPVKPVISIHSTNDWSAFCIFPFKYLDVTYNNCIKQNSEVPWCATQVASDGRVVKATYCDNGISNGDLYKLSIAVSAVETRSGQVCKFPYYHHGQKIHTCMISATGVAACATELKPYSSHPMSYDICVKYKYTNLPITFTVTGKKCIFPYIIKNKVHNKCYFENGYTWCPIKLHPSGKIKQQEQCVERYIAIFHHEATTVKPTTSSLRPWRPSYPMLFPRSGESSVKVIQSDQMSHEIKGKDIQHNHMHIYHNHSDMNDSPYVYYEYKDIHHGDDKHSDSIPYITSLASIPDVLQKEHFYLPRTANYKPLPQAIEVLGGNRKKRYTVSGKQCIIPFMFNDTVRYDCVEEGKVNWCPVYFGKSTYKEICEDDLKLYKNNENRCIFPIRIGNVLYDHCIRIPNYSKRVCATEVNQHGRIVKFKFCLDLFSNLQ